MLLKINPFHNVKTRIYLLKNGKNSCDLIVKLNVVTKETIIIHQLLNMHNLNIR